jgi:hypothetical protein
MLSPAEVIDRQGEQEDKKQISFQSPSTLSSGICRSGRPVPEHLTRAVIRKSSRFCCVARLLIFAELLLSCKSRQAVFGDNHNDTVDVWRNARLARVTRKTIIILDRSVVNQSNLCLHPRSELSSIYGNHRFCLL